MTSIQINIRVSKDLAQEIEEVSSMLKIDRSDWIRIALARGAFEEHKRLLTEVEELHKMMESDMGRILQKMSQRSAKR
ncbi:MAG: hypothetical protein ABIG20_05275 [archaeon]